MPSVMLLSIKDKQEVCTMKCPLCKKEMKTVKIEKIELDECSDGCHGLWFDIKELQKLDEKAEGSGGELARILAYDRAKDLNPFRKVNCPRCNIKMQRHEYIDQSRIYIDECFKCGGIWLDRGELGAIRENFKSYDNVTDVVEKMLMNDPTFRKYMDSKGMSQSGVKNLLSFAGSRK